MVVASGTKANPLKHAIDVSQTGNHLPVPVSERDVAQQMKPGPTPPRELAVCLGPLWPEPGMPLVVVPSDHRIVRELR